MTPAIPFTARIRHRARARSREWRVRAGLAAAGLGRAVLATAGLPLEKEFLQLGCAAGDDASGLFSEMAAVIGALEHVETWRAIHAGLRVDFGRDGLYYEMAAGDNWWEYYFEPIDFGSRAGAAGRTVAAAQHDAFAYRVERAMPRATAAALVQRYVRAKPFLLEAVDQFWRERIADEMVIGVHYRGTDKCEDSAIVPYQAVSAAVRSLRQAEALGEGAIFVATDDQGFLEHARNTFPGRVAALDMQRAKDGRPLHKAPGGGFARGTDAVMDCLLLARCHRLIRTPSNLGLCSTFFNPDLPVTLVERG